MRGTNSLSLSPKHLACASSTHISACGKLLKITSSPTGPIPGPSRPNRGPNNPNRKTIGIHVSLEQGHAYKWTVAQVEDDSNRRPIAIQSRSNRPNSITPTRIVASNCPLFPHILCSDFIPNVTFDSLKDQNSTRTDCDKDMLTSGQLLKLRMIPIAIQSRSNRAPTAPTVPLLLA